MLAVARVARAAVAGALVLFVASPVAATGMEIEPKSNSRAPGAMANTTTDICHAGGQVTDVGYYMDTRRGEGTARMNPALCASARAVADHRFATPLVNTYEQHRRDAERSVNREAQVPTVQTPTVEVRVDPAISLPTLRTPHPPELDLGPPPAPPRIAPLPPGDWRPVEAIAPTSEGAEAETPASTGWAPWMLPAAGAASGAAGPGQGATGPATGSPSLAPMAAFPAAPPALLGGLGPAPLVQRVVVSAALGLLAWAAVGLYHRLAPSQQLDHPARRALYDAVRAAPGARLAELARATGLHPKTVRYHATSLVTAKVLARDAEGGYRLPGVAGAEPLDARLLAAVRAEPGVHVAELARRVGVSKACAQSHVTGLLLSGALVGRREAGARRLFPS